MIEEIKKGFIEEASKSLEGIQEGLANVSGEEGAIGVADSVFYTMHSLKGSGPMFGFAVFGEYALPIEKTFNSIRNGNLSFSLEVAQKTLEVVDFFKELLVTSEYEISEEREKLIQYFVDLSLQQNGN